MKTFPLKSFIALGVVLAGLAIGQNGVVAVTNPNTSTQIQHGYAHARIADGVETHGKNSPKPA